MNRHFSNELVQVDNKNLKRCSNKQWLGKCKSKPSWDTTSHPVTWLWKDMQLQVLARRWRGKNPHTLLMGTQNGAASLKSSLLPIPQKLHHKVSLLPSNSNPGYIPRRNKICWHKNMYTNVHNSIIHTSTENWNASVHQMMNEWTICCISE